MNEPEWKETFVDRRFGNKIDDHVHYRKKYLN